MPYPILKQEATGYLDDELKISKYNSWQDWDIEFADANRIEEFISFYQNKNLDNDCKLALMSLIIASFDDYISTNDKANISPKWQSIEHHICNNKALFKELLEYWSLSKENDNENIFLATPYIRSLD